MKGKVDHGDIIKARKKLALIKKRKTTVEKTDPNLKNNIIVLITIMKTKQLIFSYISRGKVLHKLYISHNKTARY